MAPQSELVRVVRTLDGGLLASRTAPGRGAWLCDGSLTCVDLAARRKAFSRALRAPVAEAGIAAMRANMEKTSPDVRG